MDAARKAPASVLAVTLNRLLLSAA